MTDQGPLRKLLDAEPLTLQSDPTPQSARCTVGAHTGHKVGSGTGWLLVDKNAMGSEDSLPAGFASMEAAGAELVMQSWADAGFKSGILWLHQTSAAGVLAVPTGLPHRKGSFKFFLWRGFGPILPLPAWSLAGWFDDPTVFYASQEAALAFGNAALGLAGQ